MAMRMLSKAEFYSELEKNGFVKTDREPTTENTFWFHKKTNNYYPIPHYMEEVPDAILDTYLALVDKLYPRKEQPADCESKTYTVKENTHKPHLDVVK